MNRLNRYFTSTEQQKKKGMERHDGLFAKVVWDNEGLVKHINNTQTRDASWIKQYVVTLWCLHAVIHFFFHFSVQQECRCGKWIRCTQGQWWICWVFSCLICCRRLWLAYPNIKASSSSDPFSRLESKRLNGSLESESHISLFPKTLQHTS